MSSCNLLIAAPAIFNLSLILGNTWVIPSTVWDISPMLLNNSLVVSVFNLLNLFCKPITSVVKLLCVFIKVVFIPSTVFIKLICSALIFN